MIPSTLYIPTSTLNFNNIISSESISPAQFYYERGFGYKRFDKVKPNNLDKRIVLYKQLPIFEIDDIAIENYPMVIQIATEYINEDIIKETEGKYYAEETIYLNPFNSKIIFRNEKEKFSTLSKAEPSIETKLVALYSGCCEVLSATHETMLWQESNLADSPNNIHDYIAKDRRLNKLKGFLYAYLLASNRLVSPDIISLKKFTKQLKNILSSVIANPNRKATEKQEEELNSVYSSINEVFYRTYIAPIVNQKNIEYGFDFYKLLEQENIFDDWLRRNNLSKFLIESFGFNAYDINKEFDSYISKIEKRINAIPSKDNITIISAQSLPTIINSRIHNIPDKKEFLAKLFNEYLEEVYSSEEFVQSRYEFAKAGGKVFKEELGEKWNGSPWQIYINALLKNLNEFSAFDIKSASNQTLESFAAFCQKGDYEIEKLEEYLISNAIADYRIAYGLWGVVFGFANMPKTLTDELFLSEDLERIGSIYKHIFKQLHGIELSGELEKVQHTAQNSNIQVHISEELKRIDIVQVAAKLKIPQKHHPAIEQIYNTHNEISKQFFDSLSKVNGLGTKSIAKLKEALGYSESKSLNQASEDELFARSMPELGKEFYNDPNIWFHIEELLPNNKKVRKQVKEDLEWFQNEYMKGKDSGYYGKASKENERVIDSFERYLEKKGYYKKISFVELINKLEELYLDNAR